MSPDFSVIAIIAAYNEADIIDDVLADLIEQGISVYFLDDSSTDGTLAAAERRAGHGVVGVERLPAATTPGKRQAFDWERILRRKTQLAEELDADWFIHHDADEFRESPWPHLSLLDAVRHVDALGFNAIDFSGFDFWPVHDRFRTGDHIRETFTRYSELAPYDRMQIRCWKKTTGLDLTSSGGHEAQFPGRRVFPLRFILRHYPIRGQSHGARKVLEERQTRFRQEERAKGWHVQYDQIGPGDSFLRDPSTLTPYDPEAVRLALTLHPRYPDDVEKALGAARVELEAAKHEIAAAHGETAAVRSEVKAMREEIDGASVHIEHVTATLSEARSQLRARDKTIATLEGALDSHRTDLAAHTAYMTALTEALNQRAAEVAQWRTAVDGLTRRLDDFEHSLTWRLTAPIRAIVRIFRPS